MLNSYEHVYPTPLVIKFCIINRLEIFARVQLIYNRVKQYIPFARMPCRVKERVFEDEQFTKSRVSQINTRSPKSSPESSPEIIKFLFGFAGPFLRFVVYTAQIENERIIIVINCGMNNTE